MTIHYKGEELKFFDKAQNFRKYQVKLYSKFLKDDFVEVGCGLAPNFIYYKKYLNNILLLEPAKNLYLKLKKKKLKNVKIKCSVLNKIKKKFNTILYSDVLEHIDNDINELKIAKNKLKKNGNLIIISPAFNFLYSEYDRELGHIKRYSTKDFHELAKKLSLKVIKIQYFDCIGFLLLVLSKFFKLKNQNLKIKTIFWNSLVPTSALIDKIILNSFGKSVICVLRK